jgi:hypothetical protein
MVPLLSVVLLTGTLASPRRDGNRAYFPRNGCAWKNSHITPFALIENVVGPSTDSIGRENSLPGHVWPPPVIR